MGLPLSYYDKICASNHLQKYIDLKITKWGRVYKCHEKNLTHSELSICVRQLTNSSYYKNKWDGSLFVAYLKPVQCFFKFKYLQKIEVIEFTKYETRKLVKTCFFFVAYLKPLLCFSEFKYFQTIEVIEFTKNETRKLVNRSMILLF